MTIVASPRHLILGFLTNRRTESPARTTPQAPDSRQTLEMQVTQIDAHRLARSERTMFVANAALYGIR
jgi:hypothetical protein